MKRNTIALIAALAPLTWAAGCSKASKTTNETQPVASAMAKAKAMAPADCPLEKGEPPPIDCPFHGMGAGAGTGVGHGAHKHHHGDKHRPFASVKKYITFLDRKDRDLWQKPEAVITKLGLQAKDVVADVGAGSGYFALRIAKRYPQGRVIAIDVEPKMLAHIQQRAKALKLTNVTTALATSSDPKVDSKPDLVLVADVLHHVPDQPAWLNRLFKAMKPGARLAVIEFKEGNLPKGPPAHIKIPRKKLLALLTKPGFQNPVVYDKLLPYQILVVLGKPSK